MATNETVFLNGPTLSSSTAVFTDAALTTCAPDGFYSDGSVVREQVDCVLLPPVICPSCTTPCNTNIIGEGSEGVYYIDTNTGSNLGAIVVRFQPLSVPDGIIAELGANSYNGMSSQNYGWLQGTVGFPTYVGQTSADCGIVAGSPHVDIPTFEYKQSGFVDTASPQTVTVVSGQLDLTTNAPGMCTMVIPKTSNAYSILNTYIYGLCVGTSFSIEIECPQVLPTWQGSIGWATGDGACLLNTSVQYYYVHVNGSGGVLGLYDMVFSDPNGEFPLSAGFYNTGAMSPSYRWIQVDANGVIISFGICVDDLNFIVEKCYTNEQVIITAPGTLIPGNRVLVDGHPGCIWEVISTTASPSTATFISSTTDPCTSQCASWVIENTIGTPLSFNYEDCDGNTVTFSLNGTQTITLCARQILTTPVGLTVTLDDCDCSSVPDVWELNGCCDNDTVYAIANVPVTIGDLVKVSDTSISNCWYEVIGTTISSPTTTIVLNNNGAFNCSSVCCQYEVCNTDPSNSHSIDYTGCDGVPTIITIPPLTCSIVCARAGSFGPSVLTVTFQSCTC